MYDATLRTAISMTERAQSAASSYEHVLRLCLQLRETLPTAQACQQIAKSLESIQQLLATEAVDAEDTQARNAAVSDGRICSIARFFAAMIRYVPTQLTAAIALFPSVFEAACELVRSPDADSLTTDLPTALFEDQFTVSRGSNSELAAALVLRQALSDAVPHIEVVPACLTVAETLEARGLPLSEAYRFLIAILMHSMQLNETPAPILAADNLAAFAVKLSETQPEQVRSVIETDLLRFFLRYFDWIAQLSEHPNITVSMTDGRLQFSSEMDEDFEPDQVFLNVTAVFDRLLKILHRHLQPAVVEAELQRRIAEYYQTELLTPVGDALLQVVQTVVPSGPAFVLQLCEKIVTSRVGSRDVKRRSVMLRERACIFKIFDRQFSGLSSLEYAEKLTGLRRAYMTAFVATSLTSREDFEDIDSIIELFHTRSCPLSDVLFQRLIEAATQSAVADSEASLPTVLSRRVRNQYIHLVRDAAVYLQTALLPEAEIFAQLMASRVFFSAFQLELSTATQFRTDARKFLQAAVRSSRPETNRF